MPRQLPSGVRKTIEEGFNQIEKAIQDLETKNSIENLIQSYSKLDRIAIFGKWSYLIESLVKLCGKSGAELILNILNRGSSEGALGLVEQAKSNVVKQFLVVLVMKYGAQYQWVFDPFPNDWERYNFSTKYSGTHHLPVISVRIVDKSGKLLELESPLTTYIDLVIAFVQHLKNINEEMKELDQPYAVQKIVTKDKLKKIRKTVEEMLERPKKN